MEVSPFAIVELIVGILFVIIGVKGTQAKIFSTITGHTSTPTSAATASGPTAAGPVALIPNPVSQTAEGPP